MPEGAAQIRANGVMLARRLNGIFENSSSFVFIIFLANNLAVHCVLEAARELAGQLADNRFAKICHYYTQALTSKQEREKN